MRHYHSSRLSLLQPQPHQIPSMMQTGQRLGMQTLDPAYAEFLKRGLIEPSADPAEARRRRGLLPGAAGQRPRSGKGHARPIDHGFADCLIW